MTQSNTPDRILWVDILRGLAILFMIPANLSPYMVEPHHMWYRLTSSFAAPIFIMLSAGMVILRAERHSASYYAKRALAVVSVGVMLDLFLWQILPFTSFDVLYVIGIAMMVVYFLRRSGPGELLIISLILFLASYALQLAFGYYAEPLEVYYTEELFWPGFGRLMSSWFIDGWFPLFPWVGFATLGASLFKTMFQEDGKARTRRYLPFGLLLCAAGAVLLYAPIPHFENFASNGILENRGGYSEIFYPPTIGYLALAVGVVLLHLRFVPLLPKNAITEFIAFFGNYSMLVYILHQVFGVYLVKPILMLYGMEQFDVGWMFTLANLGVIALIYVLCLLVGLVKKKFPYKNVFLLTVFGR